MILIKNKRLKLVTHSCFLIHPHTVILLTLTVHQVCLSVCSSHQHGHTYAHTHLRLSHLSVFVVYLSVCLSSQLSHISTHTNVYVHSHNPFLPQTHCVSSSPLPSQLSVFVPCSPSLSPLPILSSLFTCQPSLHSFFPHSLTSASTHQILSPTPFYPNPPSLTRQPSTLVSSALLSFT